MNSSAQPLPGNVTAGLHDLKAHPLTHQAHARSLQPKEFDTKWLSVRGQMEHNPNTTLENTVTFSKVPKLFLYVVLVTYSILFLTSFLLYECTTMCLSIRMLIDICTFPPILDKATIQTYFHDFYFLAMPHGKEDLSPQSGIEPWPSTVKTQSPNHGNTRELSKFWFLILKKF